MKRRCCCKSEKKKLCFLGDPGIFLYKDPKTCNSAGGQGQQYARWKISDAEAREPHQQFLHVGCKYGDFNNLLLVVFHLCLHHHVPRVILYFFFLVTWWQSGKRIWRTPKFLVFISVLPLIRPTANKNVRLLIDLTIKFGSSNFRAFF